MLKDKRLLIVGGGGEGIGRAITRAATSAGASGIAVVGSSIERTKSAASEVARHGTKGVPLIHDVRTPGSAERAIAETIDHLGGIDVLITVVGGAGLWAPTAPVHQTRDEHWQILFEMNLNYVFRFVRAVLPHFIEKCAGTIVSVGSVVGSRSSPHACAYGAAKAGLMNLARTVSVEYASRGIRMNVVNPGLTLTPRMLATTGSAIPFLDEIPMGRAGTPEEIANAVVFVASPLASYASGQVIDIDGGAMSTFPFDVSRLKRK
jgi:3-oxoacyl-[acyl-carrier protein] reductase